MEVVSPVAERLVLGLIVNPVAGLGGRVGLKGSDGEEIQRRARALGARPTAPGRACAALAPLLPHRHAFDLLTYPAEMGEEAARRAGFSPRVIGEIHRGATTAEDTRRAASQMLRLGARLILFAGGDGTARDVVDAVGESVPTLGIPAGVKIHSACFATSPERAGQLALRFLLGQDPPTNPAEVMDLDEDEYRAGRLAPRLYGVLRVPFERQWLQGRKAPTPLAERAALDAIALDVIESMAPQVTYIVGPGTTTRAILEHMGLEKTLLGVDVLRGGQLILRDCSEASLLQVLEAAPARIVLSPVGGQGYVLGRGNQPISPAVIRKVGPENLVVVSTPHKIHALQGRPLLVDSGDRDVDRMLSGYRKVITGYGERIVYRVAAG